MPLRCRLVELSPSFMGAGGDGIYSRDATTGELIPAPRRQGIGLMFLCPCVTCFPQLTGDKEHDWQFRHFVAFANPIDGGDMWDNVPTRPHWHRVGETFDTLQLTPSILSDPAKGGCGWHGFIGSNGAAPGEVITT